MSPVYSYLPARQPLRRICCLSVGATIHGGRYMGMDRPGGGCLAILMGAGERCGGRMPQPLFSTAASAFICAGEPFYCRLLQFAVY